MTVIFTFICVTAVSIVLFGFWVLTTLFKTIWRLIQGAGEFRSPTTSGRDCMNAGCRTANPVHASFCRRCGSNLNQVVVNRLPMPKPRFNPQIGRGRQAASI